MNHYNNKHDVVIQSRDYVKEKSPKDGENYEHFNDVITISFFQRKERNKNSYSKIEVRKEFIIDLYNQIQKIESESTIKPYEKGLPF